MRLNTAQKLALNIDSHIVIDAGAGTGKTSTIVHRVIEHYLTEDQRATRILPTPERPARLPGGMITAPSSERIDLREWGGLLPGEVVLLTFTNRAADEMRDRLRNDIAGLKPGPAGSDETGRSDPRIRDAGFGEQLLTLLEDAPIGTIDSFLNRLVSPYRGHLGDALSRENVSDAGRAMLVESALNSLWRLPNSTSRIGEAVDAGLPSHMAPDILAARDRIASHYSGRWTAAKVLRSLVDKSVFIEEASRSLIKGGRFSADLLYQQIMASIDPSDIRQHTELIHSIISRFCDLVKDNSAVLALDGWPAESRMACLDRLSANLPDGPWEQLVWLGHVLECTLNRGGYLRNGTPSFLPYNNLPSDDWVAGINKVSSIKDSTTKEHVKSGFKAVSDDLKFAWSTNHGLLVLHFTKLAMFLDGIRPPASPESWRPTVTSLPEPLPERIDRRPQDYGFSLEAEVRNLEDLYLVHQGFKGILQKLKERDEVHDFDDIQRLAGDLLLANCPSACRSFYPESLQNTLDSISDSPWTDDHIHMTFDQLDSLEANPSLAGEAASDLGAIRNDLQYRFDLLRSIRRRYRAFIIDEAQDNSPLQWRLLARLWGKRRFEEGEPETPDTPWQPTVCYVGDVKQSIYAFRQAEVTGFLEYAHQLMLVNDHEFASVPALVRKPSLRRDSHSRDPRNAHALTIAKASEHMEKGGRDLVPWIPFNATDRNLPSPGESEVNLRRRGMIALQVNYRTSGGLLRAMNEWWEDILSHRHRLFPAADFYATPQTLFANPDKQDDSGTIEWLCPLSTGGEQDPP
ncbi:MAG: UvrD-helicase domain-containing protein, partial [Candidatus Thermoplasmatota archaeon]|nr:UvrD-helicase domain-containing protein [Candidatus Thermoplasmatota archaeon]